MGSRLASSLSKPLAELVAFPRGVEVLTRCSLSECEVLGRPSVYGSGLLGLRDPMLFWTT